MPDTSKARQAAAEKRERRRRNREAASERLRAYHAARRAQIGQQPQEPEPEIPEVPEAPPAPIEDHRRAALLKARAALAEKRARQKAIREAAAERMRLLNDRRRQKDPIEEHLEPADEFFRDEEPKAQRRRTLRRSRAKRRRLEFRRSAAALVNEYFNAVERAVERLYNVLLAQGVGQGMHMYFPEDYAVAVPIEFNPSEQALHVSENPSEAYDMRQSCYKRLRRGLEWLEDQLASINHRNKDVYLRSFISAGARTFIVTPSFLHSMDDYLGDVSGFGVEYANKMDWLALGSGRDAVIDLAQNSVVPPPMAIGVRNVISSYGKVRPHRAGAGAPWKNTLHWLDLRRYQIDFDSDPQLTDQDGRDHCFLYALRQSGQISPEVLLHVASELNGRHTTLKSVKDICMRFNIAVQVMVYTDRSEHSVHINCKTQRPIKLGLFDGHYFLNDGLEISEWVLRNPDEAGAHGPLCGSWAYRRVGDAYERDPRPFTLVGPVLRKMRELERLVKIRGDDPVAMVKAYHNAKQLDLNDLRYCPEFCPEIKLKSKGNVARKLWFADFESTTKGVQHLPYMLCAVSEAGEKFETHDYLTTPENVERVWSVKVSTMLKYVGNHTPEGVEPLIYFHNLNYDMAFIVPYVHIANSFKVVEISNKIIGFRLFHPLTQRWFTFRDSYALISAPLREFGKMFHLKIEKEIFPYEYYNTSNFDKDLRAGEPAPAIDEYLGYHSDGDALLRKLVDLNFLREDGRVDAHGYSKYYCMRDCEVLRDGVMKFREQLREVTGLDCADYMTLPSIAYNYLIKEGVFAGCYNLAGAPLFFIRRCVLGGRCMLQRNKKRDVRGDISDFDAVSLYPSAMARIYTLQGLPKIIDDETRSLETLFAMDGFFAEVEIGRVGRALDFPLLAAPGDSGVMVYSNDPGTYMVDDITLRNIIESHRVDPADIRVVRGYYYNEGKNYRIRTVIQHLFNERLRLKREGNPLEQAYKLLMNSCYGKSIMKPIMEEVVVATHQEFQRLLNEHGCETLSYRQAGSRFIMNVSKNIVSAVGFPAFGVHVLAMSKLIMSEVMVTAQDLGIDVYYTDTDSIHLRSEAIPRLAAAFEEKYGRELIGKKLGQFHTDFPNHPVTGNPTTSRRFIGVGKKAYVDELVDPTTGAITYHMRLKGIPQDTIVKTADALFEGDIIKLYEHLYKGNSVPFDLLNGRVSFALNSDLTYSTRDKFERIVRFV